MRIAVAADKAGLGGVISGRLSDAKALLIIKMDDDPKSAVITEKTLGCTEKEMAERAAEEGCEAFISGVLGPEGFGVLAGAQMTRYNGSGLTVIEGIRRMQARSLECFTRIEGEKDTGNHTCGTERYYKAGRWI